MIALALAGLRARRSRTLLAAAGVLAASLVVGTGATVGYGLATGFERAADQADLPDVIARFDASRAPRSTSACARCPTSPRARTASSATTSRWRPNGHHTHRGAMHVVLGGRRGYLVTEGRDLSGRPGEVVSSRGSRASGTWRSATRIDVGRPGALRLVGIAVSPDNVAFPLARAARVYVPAARRRPANIALLWLNDPLEGGRHAHPGALGVVRPRAARVRHARGRAGAARPGGGDRDLAAGRVLARGAGRGRDDARGGRARRRAAAARRVRRPARARLHAGADRRRCRRRRRRSSRCRRPRPGSRSARWRSPARQPGCSPR